MLADEKQAATPATRNSRHAEKAFAACLMLLQALNDYCEEEKDETADEGHGFPGGYWDAQGMFWAVHHIYSSFNSAMIGVHAGYLNQLREVEYPDAKRLAELLLKPPPANLKRAPARAMATVKMLLNRCNTHKERKALQTLMNAAQKIGP